MTGILAYGAYLPHHRLDRTEITAALGSGGGRGTRAVASYDEDATSMAVEAGRRALRAGSPAPAAVLLATSTPPYLDKTNATAVHAALSLDAGTAAYDFAGAARSTAGALRAALGWGRPALVVGSDVCTGLPGGADEAGGGDGAAALLCGDGDVIAELVGWGTATAELLDRWRLPGEVAPRHWEERFGEQAYLPLAEQAVTDACKDAGTTPDQVQHVVLAGTHPRALRRLAGSLGVTDPAVFGTDLASTVGATGAAALPLGLADALDRAQPGELILAVSVADGADAFVLRATERITSARPGNGTEVATQAAAGAPVAYATFLTWRGILHREPPRRPDPVAPAAPPSRRREHWKFGFTGSRCRECDTRHLPPQRVCLECGTVDQMDDEPLADVPGTVVTYTVDHLAFSLDPPTVVAVIDFDGGGRFQCELTDVDPTSVAIGDRVEMTFRRIHTSGGVHNYFWKARPARRAG